MYNPAESGHGLMVERYLAKVEIGVRFSVPAQIERSESGAVLHAKYRALRSLLPPGFEPGTTVPKTAVISVSPRELGLYNALQCLIWKLNCPYPI